MPRAGGPAKRDQHSARAAGAHTASTKMDEIRLGRTGHAGEDAAMGGSHGGVATTIADSSGAVALFAPALAGLKHEELHIALLDGDMRLLKRTNFAGSCHGVDIPLRALMTQALALDARCLLIAHNHPGGDPTPSPADKFVTRRLADIAAALEIRLLDHLVFAGGLCASFRELGLL
jgi:DNA repair protein RadC